MTTLLQWELSDKGGLMLSDSAETPRPVSLSFMSTIWRQNARGSGVWALYSGMISKATIPDDNLLSLATPPRTPVGSLNEHGK